MLRSEGAPVSTIGALYDHISPAVEDALLATAKTFGRSVPAPRRDPFHGLDRWDGPDLRLMERLTAHGDFRKYVFVLDAGGGLGGLARWLTLTYGCRVLVLDVVPRVVALARRLSERAMLGGRVHAVAGDFEAIPARDGAFTQIWSVEALQHAADRRRALAELFRVLRPGSTLALHEIVRRADDVRPLGGAWRHGTQAEYLHLLGAAGFTHVDSEDVTGERAEPSAVERSAHDAFLRRLDERDPVAAAAWRRHERERESVRATIDGPDYAAVHFFARRPSV